MPFPRILLLCLLFVNFRGCFCTFRVWRRSIRVLVNPGAIDCYFVANVSVAQTVGINFQVIRAGLGRSFVVGSGPPRLTVRMYDPFRALLEVFSDNERGRMERVADVAGDYSACIDNTRHAGTASVFMHLERMDQEPEGDEEYYYYEGDDDFASEEMKAMHEADVNRETEFHMKVDDIKAVLRRIRSKVHSAEESQSRLVMESARDFHLAASLRDRTDTWAAVHTAAVVAAAAAQVAVVKTFFR